ncbi:uncharacterized protein PRCAT00001540001 [Priceomyces carsonii]|uniref:uncharacterized protein n=1 Tax=Priceomyces carsonii TaxID=28549 RepID=UPI002EDB997C|nr:unnamed protein product [Priceomyces carsonii]
MVTGPDSLKDKKYPAKEHAKRVYSHLIDRNSSKSEVAFFMSGEGIELHPHTDQTKVFRQGRYFFYLSGCNIPGSHLLYIPVKEELILYLPDIDYDDVMWSGLPMSLEEASKTFDVDKVKYVSKLSEDIQNLKEISILTTDINKWNQKFSRRLIEGDEDFFYALDESRVIKDWYEIELLKYTAKITDKCHFAVMSAIPIETNETHIHAEFMYHALRQGSKSQSYDPICCSGTNCSTLHYTKNDEDITPTRRSILIDAGTEWSCYTSDVTRCFPINGDWTKEHLEIYNTVLKMQTTAMNLIKPGASWEDIHLTCHKVLIEEFLKLGIFDSKYSKEEIFASKISGGFFPHGLGHMLGLDTHDVAGYPNYEDPNPLLQYLRIRRDLKEGMVVTNEPGAYFSPFLLKSILADEDRAKYINKKVLDNYWYVGGVRIEDDVLVTKDGCQNLTQITSDPAQISKIVKSGLAKGKEGFHNVV